MKRVIGFALLFIAVGMFIMMVLPSIFCLRFAVFTACLLTGYFLFCK